MWALPQLDVSRLSSTYIDIETYLDLQLPMAIEIAEFGGKESHINIFEVLVAILLSLTSYHQEGTWEIHATAPANQH